MHKELWKLHLDHNCTNYGVRKDINVSGYSLYVLKNTNMPAILTESGFMDNMVEAKYMLDRKFQIADAEATCKGICKTFDVTYVEPNEEFICTEEVEVYTTTKYVKVLVDILNIRNCPSWSDNAVAGTVKKNEVFTVTKKLKVGNSYMYKLKSGLYITASTNYVKSMTSL